jgi:glycosyltransferase involved in cell wall biosynthesis
VCDRQAEADERGKRRLIAFVINVWPDPRVEKEVLSLTNHGFKVTILAWDREKAFDDFESLGNRTICKLRLRAPYNSLVISSYYPLFWLWVLSKLLRMHPAVVHADNLDSVVPALLYRLLRPRTKVLFDVSDSYAMLVRPRSRILSNIILCVELFAASMSDAFTTVSSNQLAVFEAANLRRVRIVMNTPLPAYWLEPRVQSKKQMSFRIVYAGIIIEDRGLLQLCEATKELDDIELIVAGRINSRKMLTKITEFSNVDYVGQLSHEEALQLQASADLIPVLYDLKTPINRIAMPNKIFEAMMLGVPIITNVTHLVDIVKDFQCGLAVDYNNVETVKQAILYLKDHPEIGLQMGVNGKKAFEQKFNWNIMEERLLNLYDQLLSADN